MSRTFGWIQDGGSFDNLKRVILSIVPESRLNQRLREELIPNFVPEWGATQFSSYSGRYR